MTERSRFNQTIDRIFYTLSRHWLAAFNIVIMIYVGLPMLAPVLMNVGAERAARTIYTMYSPLCHQMASRSFFLFGDQYAYPRELAGTELTPIEAFMPGIEEFEGISAEDVDSPFFLLAARRFLGTEEMGYKMALCERDMAIYGAVLLFGLLYGLLRGRVNFKPLPIWAFIVFGMGPIALDGFSQLFSQYGAIIPPLAFINDFLPIRESTPLLRSFTGAMFGFFLAWLTLPRIDPGMQKTADDIGRRLVQE